MRPNAEKPFGIRTVRARLMDCVSSSDEGSAGV